MGFPLSKVFAGALKILPHIGTAVAAVQAMKGNAPGHEKQDAAVDLVKLTVQQIEGAIESDILDDELVEAAVRESIDAAVKLANVVNDARARRALSVRDPRTVASAVVGR